MKFLLAICTFFFIYSEAAEPTLPKKTICLNMIVKNEARVIEKCLASVKPLIDYWVIVDTGSVDKTQETIKNFMHETPGELHARPWVDFAHNRNEALSLAKGKGDYILLLDADEVLQFSENFSLPHLEKDFYFIPLRQVGAADVKRTGLINNRLNWKWQGVLHEVIYSPEAVSSEVLQDVVNLCNTHGETSSGRSQDSVAVKYLRDAEVLEKALQQEPTNSRYAYYLGISYFAAQKYELAKKSFERRLSMPSADIQETFFALYNLGLIEELLGHTDEALETFFKAHSARSSRAEPLFQCAKLYRKKGNILLGYLLTKHALSLPYPKEDLCIEYTVYDYNLLIEFANCALLLGKFDEGLETCNKLLMNPNLPAEYRSQVVNNQALAKSKLAGS